MGFLARPPPQISYMSASSGNSNSSSLRHALAMAGALALALLIRLTVRSELAQTIYGEALLPDEQTYHSWAVQLAKGIDDPSYARDFAPFPALVFASLYRLVGIASMHVRALNVALGVATCGLVYVTGRVLYGSRNGVLAALICALSESLALYSGTALNTTLGVFVFAALIAVQATALQWPMSSANLKAGAAGALSGLLANTRGNAAIVGLLLFPFLYLALRCAGQTRNGALRSLRVPMLTFVVAYSLSASLTGGLAGPPSAFNLFLGNNPDNPTPYFQPARFTSSAPEAQVFGFVVEASRRSGSSMSIDDAQAFWIAQIIGNAIDHPAATALHLGKKALAIINVSPSDNNHDLRIFRTLAPALSFAFLRTWFVFALACSSIFVLPRDRRLAFGVGVSVLYAATIVLFFAGERIRVPLVVVAAPFAAAALTGLVTAVHKHEKHLLARSLAVVLLVGGIAHVPVEGSDDMTFAYNIHALTFFQVGDSDSAKRWYMKSLTEYGAASAGARIGLAAVLQRENEIATAIAMLTRMPDSHYEAANKYQWLGNLELAERAPDRAARAYEAAIAIDASRESTYKALYVAYRMLGDNDSANRVDGRLHDLIAQRKRVFSP
jgi:tetratricopeptide (TPR) repeat protein